MDNVLIDTEAGVQELVDTIASSPLINTFLFIDLEGIDLSRNGYVSIMQVLVAPDPTVHLIDIHTLQRRAFDTQTAGGVSFRDILESERYPKVFFDVRFDSDALYAHFGISLRCVIDLQLAEFITRTRPSQYLSSLARCIRLDLNLSHSEADDFARVKGVGRQLFAPERGGRPDVFNERPLPPALVEYCGNDVRFMPRLLLRYASRLARGRATQLQAESEARVWRSQGAVPLPKGPHMTIGPAVPYLIGYQPAILRHPMNIICSPEISSYCRLNVSSTATPATTAQPVTPAVDAAIPSDLSHTLDTSAVTSSVETLQPVSPSMSPITTPLSPVDQALLQLRQRKQPDFTLDLNSNEDLG